MGLPHQLLTPGQIHCSEWPSAWLGEAAASAAGPAAAAPAAAADTPWLHYSTAVCVCLHLHLLRLLLLLTRYYPLNALTAMVSPIIAFLSYTADVLRPELRTPGFGLVTASFSVG